MILYSCQESLKTYHPPSAVLYLCLQLQKNMAVSTLQLFRSAIKLRRDPSFLQGSMKFLTVTEDIFSFVRHHPASKPYAVALNVGHNTHVCDFSKAGLQGKVVLVSCNMGGDFTEGETLDLRSIVLKPGHGLVIY